MKWLFWCSTLCFVCKIISCRTYESGDCSQCLVNCDGICVEGEFYNNGSCTTCPSGFMCVQSTAKVCPSGQFSVNGSSHCTQCPAGYSCLDPSQNPIVCSAGTYSIAGSTQCTSCPEGSYSLEGDAGCLECPPGHYCRNGTTFTAPISCTAGEYSPGGVSTCLTCPEGSYSEGGAATCLSCLPGHYCPPASSTSPLPCPAGSWSPGSASSCETCPPGYSCGSAVSTPLPCQPGEWSPIGSDSCLLCPAGASCIDPTQPPVLCSSGQYSPEGEAYCRLCPTGYNCSDEGLDECPEGYYSALGTLDCESCPVGHACPLPFLSPLPCQDGQHTGGATGAVVCTDCTPGYYCPSTSLSPLACPSGTYSAARSASCSQCPPGYYCPTTSSPPLSCNLGFQSLAGSTECSPCPAGLGCPLSSDPSLNFACLPGSISSEGESVCQSCPAGMACPTTSSSVDCESGSFSLSGYTECEPCPAGWACPYTTGHGNTPCALGTYSSGNATACTLCPAGHACPSTTLDLPQPCPLGTYAQEAQSSCTPCPPGYSCDVTTAPPTVMCTPGSYSSIGAAECTPCPPGLACPSTMTSDTIDTCIAGTYSLDMFTRCETCPAGSYCPNTTALPTPCPAGYYSLEGAIACTPCPPGFSCPTSDALPVVCEVGTYSPGGDTMCSPCEPGYVCEQGSTVSNRSTALCPQGYYCPDGASQQPCPAGTYGNRTGLIQASDCTACTIGFYCPEGTSGYPTAGLRCPQGHYCPAGTTTQFEFPCPDGTYSTVFGLERENQCLNCPPGRYCSGGDAIGGQLCPRGNYCPDGSGSPMQCPGGTYTEAIGSHELSLCEQCPAGFYCTSGTDSPTPCLAGTYNPLLGQNADDDCQPCPAGQACTTIALTAPNELCSPGHFCPEGSDKIADPSNECPPGTFTDYHNLTVADKCSVCPAGWACLSGTGGVSSPRLACAMGHFCPNGTQFTTQYPCAAGSYTNSTRLQRQVECEDCPPGYFCMGGESTPSGPCDPGHYCPLGTQSATSFSCPAGTYFEETGNIRIQNCLQCTAGHYCPIASILPTPCSSGTFSDTLGATDVSTCLACPGGYSCPNNAIVTPSPCGTGFFSDNGASVCLVCSPGYYCDNVTTSLVDLHTNKICAAGLSCADGGHTSPPDLLINACPSGHYCLPGDLNPFPIPCPNGTYGPLTGLKTVDQCTPCPPGQYCSPEGRTQPAGDCAPGHYCPISTRFEDEFPCPTSTFLANASAESLDACTTCISGFYCPERGLGEPIVCPRGFYCVTGSHEPQPCPPGTYGNSTGLRRSQDCLPCPGGQYCDGFGRPEPTAPCDAGFFCRSRASVSGPTDGITGDVCPRGGFCPEGSAIQANCPVGTYGNSTGNSGPDDCIDCDPGFFCSGDNNPSPTGLCAEGCYCPGGANSSCQIPTPPGSFSTLGAAAPTPCLEGTNQQASRQSSCTPCLPGLYCPDRGLTLGETCPRGSYCPSGSAVPTPCPRGTFSDTEGLFNVSSCELCTPGSYCFSENLTAPTGLCDPGHYCLAGAELPNPGFAGEIYGNLCPPGYYCLAGTTSPTQYPCPPGTFNPSDGASTLSHCLPCTGGLVCSEFALSSPNERCSPGHFCALNATHSDPVSEVWGDLCPVGHMCPGNNSQSIICPDGSFSNATGSIVCTPCPSGSYCIEGLMILDCPPGHVCPEGTGLNWTACPSGTYNPQSNGGSLDDCLPCPGGRFCAGTGISDFNDMNAGECLAGYYCLEGIDTPTPTPPLSTGIGGLCPEGFYCPPGTGAPLPCPLGTFSNALQLTNESECQSCTPGSYCSEFNLTSPSGDCDGGFVCAGGADVPNPDGSDSTGFPCSPGNYCPPGSFAALPCNAGEYNPFEGQALCLPCPSGFYCLEGFLNFNSTVCPVGHYCPEGTTHPVEFPCPPGTYRGTTGAQSLRDCTPCDPGMYCVGGQSSPDGLCDPGWFCVESSPSPRPFEIETTLNCSQNCVCSNVSVGGQCEHGFYCPGGSNQPNPCPSGMYCDNFGLSSPTGVCSQGFYCFSAASVPNPNDGITGFPCPYGHYCGVGVTSPTPCPTGTYLNTTGSQNFLDCIPCTAGFYCGSDGLPDPSGPCQPGYFCPEGSISPNNASYICTPGHHCPEASEAEMICEGGTYQPNFGQPNCTICPEQFYCPFNASDPLTEFFDCPVGFYCPQGTQTSTQFPCPPGTYSSLPNRGNLTECNPCLGGTYCATDAISSSFGSGPCLGGYFCILGATIPNPSDGITGNICPLGHYCPQGSPEPLECPAGTFAPINGTVEVDDCVPCSPGEYCEQSGLSQPSGLCDPGYFCENKSTTPRPTDGMSGDFCQAGFFCPQGSNLPIPCPPGMFSSEPFASNCSVCPPGFYCTNASSDPLQCPPGYYCPKETGFDWRPCPAGTFSNNEGLSAMDECIPCSGGFSCSNIAATAPTEQCGASYFCTSGSDSSTPDGLSNVGLAGPCPEGNYCPLGTDTPIPCPPGTFSNITLLFEESQCIPCTPGSFCEGFGLTAPTGLCSPGYYCTLGSHTATPHVNDTTGCVCPVAHYCPPGSVIPLECEPGTYNPNIGRELCLPCPAGFFCTGNSTDVENACPVGHYCPSGTAFPLPCPAGTLNDLTGRSNVSDCEPCPSGMYCGQSGFSTPSGPCSGGWYCRLGSPTPQPNDPLIGGLCQPGFFCPNGSSSPVPCSSGSYCESEGLSDVSGPCNAGYFCSSGADTPSPTDGFTGDVCPCGHYCPLATGIPQPCSQGLYSNVTGNSAPNDCILCEPGSYCEDEGLCSPTGACAAGYYCPSGQSSFQPSDYVCIIGHSCPEGSALPMPCASGLYQDMVGKAACLSCPLGHYCVEGSVTPTPCPPGALRNETSGAAESDCDLCTGGYYCPTRNCQPEVNVSIANTTSSNNVCDANITCPNACTCSSELTVDSNIHGIPCLSGFYCPPGSPSPLICPGGHVCADRTSQPMGCSAGYHCIPGSIIQTLCEHPFYCPALSAAPLSCPSGHLARNASTRIDTLRTSIKDSCFGCQPGFFSDDGTDCYECPARYYCPGLTSNPLDFPCPAGSYCPSGSGSPTPCPAGNYNLLARSENMTDCLSCPASTFNSLPGQAACRQCGSSAVSVSDRVTCSCVGARRLFSPLTGGCLCEGGFTFFNQAGQDESETDGTIDCQPIVDQRCGLNQGRLASSRQCVDPSYSCQDECLFQGGDGTFSIILGLCQCSSLVDPLALCSGDCLDCRPQTGVRRSTNNTLLYSVSDCNGTIISEQEITGVFGVVSLDTENRRNHLVTHTSEGQITGAFPTTNIQALTQSSALTARARRRRDATITPEITNPVLCLEAGEAVLFQITQSTNGSYHYPTYVKNHLLNTNSNFDFGSFSQLNALIMSSVEFSFFVHVFHVSGTYVFADSLTPGSTVVIMVIELGTSCERDGQDFRVLPLSTTTLNQFGVTALPVVNQEPDLAAIYGILFTTLFFVIVLVLLMFIWRPKAAGIAIPGALQPVYRRVDEPKIVYVNYDNGLDSLEKRGVGVGAQTVTAGHPERFLLENFNVRTLYDKLEDQNLHVSAQLSRQQVDLRAFYDQIVQQVEGLKGLVSESSVLSTVQASREFTQSQLEDGSDERRMEPVGAEVSDEKPKVAFSASLTTEQEDMLVGLLKELLTKAGYKGPTRRKNVRVPAQNSKKELTSAVTAMQEIEVRHLSEVQNASVKLSEELSKATSDAEVDKLLKDHEESMAGLLAAQERERRQQKEELKAKLAARRNKKTAGRQQSTSSENHEDVVNNYQRHVSLTISSDIIEKYSHETQSCISNQEEMSAEIKNLVHSTVASFGGSGAVFVSELAAVRESSALNVRQIKEVRAQLELKMKERKDNLISKQQKKRSKIEGSLTSAVSKGTQTEATKVQKLEAIDAEHKNELHALERQLSLEVSVTMATLAQERAKESTDKEIQCAINCIREVGVSEGRSEDELEKICEEFKEKVEDVRSQVLSKERHQSGKFKTKQERRKSMKLAEAVEAVMASSTDTSIVVPTVQLDQSIEEQVLIEQQAQAQEELRSTQEAQLQALSQDLETDAEIQEKGLTRRLEKNKQKMLNERRQRLQAKLEGETYTEEQQHQLLATHKAELESLEKSLDLDKERQLAALKEKLEAKRGQRLDEQKRKQELSLQKELLEQKKELEQVQNKQTKEAENKAIVEGIKNNSKDKAEIVIKKVLEQRQKREMEQLEANLASERQQLVSDAIFDYQTTHSRLKKKLEDRLKAQLAETADETSKAEVMSLYERELADLEAKIQRECASAESSLGAEVEARHARARLELREKHYKEYLSALTELAPDSQKKRNSIATASTAAKELEEFKNKLESDKAKREDQLQAERENFEHAQNAILKEAMKDFEQELEAEEQNEKDKLQKSMAALQEERNRILAGRKEKIQERVTQFGDDAGEKLLQSHNKDTQKLVNKIDAQRLRMEADLQERLRKRRGSKLQIKELAIQKDILAERLKMEEKAKLERQKLAEEEAEQLESLQYELEATISVPEVAAEEEYTEAEEQSENILQPSESQLPLSQQEIMRLILATPLYEKLEHIKTVLAQGNLTPQANTVITDGGYIDQLDAQWTGDTELHVLDVTALSPRHFIVYKFGCSVMRSLEAMNGFDSITLLIADKIPPNHAYHRNSFRHSFSYDSRNKILYLRLERLENVGSFLLVLLHILTHIKTGSFESDTEHTFIKEFYHALSLICNDLFLSKYRKDSSMVSKYLPDIKTNPLQSSTRPMLETEENIVDCLLDTRILSTTDIHGNEFTHDNIMNRLQQYKQFQSGSQLRRYLDELEAAEKGDEITPPSSGESTRATQLLKTRDKWHSVLRRISRKKQHQEDNLQYQQLLAIKEAQLKQRIKEVESEYQRATEEKAAVTERIKDLEAQLTASQGAEKDSAEYQSQRKEVKKITSRLSAARTEQVTYDLRINGYLKRLERLKIQVKQKKEAIKDYM